MYTYVNLQSLKNGSKQIDNCLSDLLNYINDSKKSVENINSVWQGSDNQTFNNQMDEFFLELTKLEESLETYNNFIKGYEEAYEKLEQYYKDKEIELS